MEQIAKLRAKALKEVQKISVMTNMNDIVEKLFKVIKKHIGESKKISRRELFRAVYDISPEDCSELHEWFLWEACKRSMHRMRQRTHCFIVSKQFSISKYSARNQGLWYFWVACDYDDYKIYNDNAERNIKAIRGMVKRCETAVTKNWYKEKWKR